MIRGASPFSRWRVSLHTIGAGLAGMQGNSHLPNKSESCPINAGITVIIRQSHHRITNPKFPCFLRKFFIEIKFFSASPRLRGATGFSCFLRVSVPPWLGFGLWLWLCDAVPPWWVSVLILVFQRSSAAIALFILGETDGWLFKKIAGR